MSSLAERENFSPIKRHFPVETSAYTPAPSTATAISHHRPEKPAPLRAPAASSAFALPPNTTSLITLAISSVAEMAFSFSSVCVPNSSRMDCGYSSWL